ncbi:fatty acyl-AMP ligase [Amycolatopsis sp. WQ 127309]|uniref:fatty acyl-AMP ligase n=1 Tax=Amycolatopsis sp. WQ 127309 TaxID=2932773 RepID=UPI001FF5341D|nr:fatty acyl-AMP ligase [Amycolatopsis sp. WQ 127309]UOZ06984.1 fatty acyl-AMP ligase [Amycolatopsis sp. WQ 127309]
MTSSATLPTVLEALRATNPDRPLFTWVEDDGEDGKTLTAGELTEATDEVAQALRSWGAVPGDRAVLVYPPGLDFVTAFTGCLAAGVVPVPVYPPDPVRPDRAMRTFAKILTDCGARLALTDSGYDRARKVAAVAGFFGRATADVPQLSWHRTDRRLPRSEGAEPWHEPVSPAETAFLQYTSGSTGTPKGVVVTHGNIAHELAANVTDLRLHDGTRGVFWIPQYHDMGLINVILSTVSGNSATHLMSPLTFLRDPAVWFAVMSRVGATVTSAPNFAYDLAVRKTTAAQRSEWDLSSLEMAICAAEPVRDRTAREFQSAFAVSGLRDDVFFAAYGLAENTASVTNRGQGRVLLDKTSLAAGEVVVSDAGPHATVLRGCGKSSKAGDDIRIVDPDTGLPCPPLRVGEIWVHSATTAAGYWNQQQPTADTFHARLTGVAESRDYLRTGDLGFQLDGELFVTGRIKDLMIVGGRNVHPGDVEDSVRDCDPLVRPGGTLMFSVDGGSGEDHVVLLLETRARQLAREAALAIWAEVRARASRDHGITIDTLLIGRPGFAEKTTSGKLRRQVAKAAFLDGTLVYSNALLHALRSTGRGPQEAR